MPKPHTLPTLYDDLKKINISDLKRWKYLEPDEHKSGVINWSRGEEKTGSISIVTNTRMQSPYLELDYKTNETLINYRVQLVSIPSNIGKGVVWFFICPHSGKRCRKLYLLGGYFYHRSAFTGCMYEKQTRSKKSRQLDRTFGAYFRTDQLYEQLYKKHFKKSYAGKPTKKYLRIMVQIQQADRIPYREIERLMLS